MLTVMCENISNINYHIVTLVSEAWKTFSVAQNTSPSRVKNQGAHVHRANCATVNLNQSTRAP